MKKPPLQVGDRVRRKGRLEPLGKVRATNAEWPDTLVEAVVVTWDGDPVPRFVAGECLERVA